MADEIVYDVDGYDEVSKALLALVNNYPALEANERIEFATLGEKNGKAMFPISGAMVQTEIEDVTGHITQDCLYPFYVIYQKQGLSQNAKVNAKEWLDNLGRWLERQPVIINGQPYQLSNYPELSGQRKFEEVERQSPSYLDSVDDNKAEKWAVYISARYRNEFDKI